MGCIFGCLDFSAGFTECGWLIYICAQLWNHNSTTCLLQLAQAMQTFNRSLWNRGMFNIDLPNPLCGFPMDVFGVTWRLLPTTSTWLPVCPNCAALCAYRLFLLNQSFPILGVTAVRAHCVTASAPAVWPLNLAPVWPLIPGSRKQALTDLVVTHGAHRFWNYGAHLFWNTALNMQRRRRITRSANLKDEMALRLPTLTHYLEKDARIHAV